MDMAYYLCRLCAFKCMMPGLMIFSAEGILCDISKKIQECLQLTITEEDTYPKTICRDCVYKLDVSYEFKVKSLQSQNFLCELLRHEVLGNDFMTTNGMQQMQMAPQDFQCLNLSDELPDHHSVIQDLENLVGEVEMNAENNDISKIIEFDDDDIAEYQIEEIEETITAAAENIIDSQRDSMSLPDITLYTFDSISDVTGVENQDILIEPEFVPNDLAAAEIIVENASDRTKQMNAIRKEPKEPKAKKSEKEPKVCNECGKTFGTNYKLKEHQRTHTNETPYHCSIQGCEKKFRSKIGLIQHEAKHYGKFQFACNICGKGFQIKSYLTIHMKTHNTEKAFKCSMCEMTFKAKKGLVDHENRHLGLKRFECEICNKRFITKSLCLSHYQTHSNEVRREHQCYVCLKFFANKSCLKMHMKIHLNDKQFVCEFCGKAFLGRTDLKLHETKHTNVSDKLVCENCGKSFNRPNSLKSHMRLHTGQRPYKCKYCPQTFTQSSSLNIHTRTHTGEKPYICTHELCAKKFISRTSLQRHLCSHNNRKKVNLENSFSLNYNNCDMINIKTDCI